MNVGLSATVSGRIVGLKVVGVDGSVRESLPFDNLITNNGLDILTAQGISPRYFGSQLRFGTGSAEPQFTDTGCSAPIGPYLSFTTHSITSPSPGKVVSLRRFQSSPGGVVGNLTECALYTSNTAEGAITHALFRDGLGNPITVTVLAGEQVIVDYELVFNYSMADVTTTATVNGVPTTFTLRPAQPMLNQDATFSVAGVAGYVWYAMYGASSGMSAAGTDPTGSQANLSNSSIITPTAYVPGSFTFSRVLSVAPSDGVNPLIGAFYLTGVAPCNMQIGVSPRMSKSNLQTFKMTLSWTWSR